MPDDYTLNFNRIREKYQSRGLEDCLLKSAEILKEINISVALTAVLTNLIIQEQKTEKPISYFT